MSENDSNALQMPYQTLRLFIGWLGVALPFALVLLSLVFQTSVSDYYYTNARDILEGVLFFLAIFLFAYKPYGDDGWKDNWITNGAALFALMLGLFPTVNVTLGHVPEKLILQFIPVSWSATLHNIGSGCLFVSFAVLSLFFFTKGAKGNLTDRKKLRNAIYIVCGLGILACISIIGWGAATAPSQQARDTLNIFWPEAIALVLFGFSWLVKGEAFPFLNDKP